MSTVSYDRPSPEPRPQQRRSGDPKDPDPLDGMPSMAPNLGEDVLPHVVTFQGLLRNVARCYYPSDEAIRDSWDNARFMRNDPGIMECLEQRKRSTALLGWHLEADDEKDPTQKMLVEELTAILKTLPNFLKYRENLLDALWYGKYAVAHRYRWKKIRGQMRVVVDRWRPVNGDKLVFRYDDGSGEFDEDQVGIRVGQGYTEGSQVAKRWMVERIGKVAATDQGLAYFLEHWERPLLAIHKHQIEDGAFEAPELAGSIHGVGIRSRIYWMWYQKQETLAWLMEYLERSAFGIEIWSYPAGNSEAYEQTKKAALERVGNGRNIVLVPRHPDSDILSSDVKRIEPGMAGADILDRILREYFGWQIKRYILGQILTSETASTGLGSGVATIHLDTYLQIVRYDATNLQETLTTDLVQPLLRYNWPQYADIPIRFVVETESPDVEGKLRGWKSAYEMGLKIRAQDVADLIGAAVAKPDEEVLQDPQHVQAALQQQQMLQQQQQAAQQQAAAQAEREANEDRVLAHLFQGGQAEGYRKRRRGVIRYGRFSVGETRVVRGRTYRFNENSRWERVQGENDQKPSIAVAGNEFRVDLKQPKAWQRVFKAAMALFQGRTYVNQHTGKAIKVGRVGVNKVVHHLPDEKPIKALVKLPEMLEQADYIATAPPDDEEPNIRAYHYLGVDLMLEGQPHYAILAVREDNNGNWFYDQRIEILKKEGSSHGQVGTQTGQTGPAGEPSRRSIGPDGGEVKRNSREDYRAAAPDHQPGWRTVGGGAHVYIGKDGRIEAGCPGLKTEDVGEIGEDESRHNRQQREHRMDVAEHHGLEGEDLSHREVKQLETHPHPDTGRDAQGQPAGSPEPTRERPTTVQINGKPYEVSKIYGMWFFRQPGAPDWTVASSPMVQVIQQHGQAQQPAPQGPGEARDIPFDIPTEEAPKAKINPRSRVGRAIVQAAQDWGIAPDDLADAAEYVWEQHAAEGAYERQKALEAARKLSGLRPYEVKRLKNAGYDHTSAKRVTGQLGQRLARFDEFAQEIAREYPVLGLGNPDDPSNDFAGRLWEILDEDRATVAPMDDPELLREAAGMVLAHQQTAPAYGPRAYAYPEEFRRHGEVQRYRQWLAERYAKPAAGQKSFDWDEEEHPRKSDGTFAPKGSGETHAAAEKPATATPEEQTKYDAYVQGMTQFKLTPRSQADWLQNYREVQARLQQAGPASAEPEEPAQGFAPDDELAPEDETPRDQANRHHEKRLDADYAYARVSAVPNAGEDLLGSARHKANAWRGLEQAEEDGTAEELVTRDQLLKNEPVDLLSKVQSVNAMTALGMHLAMRAFPADPGLKWADGRSEGLKKKDRGDYLDVYRDLKRIAEDHVEDKVGLWESLDQFNKQVSQHIDRLRRNDRYNPVANALIGLYKATRRVTYGHPATRSVQGQMGEFAGKLKQAYGEADQQTLDKAVEHVKDLIEGKSLNKTFGTVQASGGKKRPFDPAELYVKHATRVGGQDLNLRTPEQATDYMVDQLQLRGVQFGNYVTDSERAHHATKCAEAMTDLASVLGIPGEYVSWKRKLGVAIGARGSSQALAHYEPGNQVINLTRKDGVGSLAHEWGHFFDHVLAGGRIVRKGQSNRSSGDYFSEWISPKRIELDEHGSVVIEEKNGRKQVKSTDLSADPLWSAFDGLRQAWKSSGFRNRLSRVTWSKVKDGTMSKAKREYWTSGRETFARCFERYVQRKLETSGRKNTYLAGISPMAYGDDGLWPTDAEVEAMTPAFDAIFRELSEGIEKGRYWLGEVGERLVLERRSPLAEQFAKAFAARGFVVRYSQSGHRIAEQVERYGKGYDESKHPRDEKGEFARKGEGQPHGNREEGPQRPFDEAGAEPHRQKALAKVQATLHTASYLSPDKQAAYGKAAHQVLHAMGAKALARWNANVRKIKFHASSETVEQLARQIDPRVPRDRIVGAFVWRKLPGSPVCELHLNGGQELQDRFPKTTVGNYAHEFAHAIDRDPVTGKPMSARPDWVEAWKAEVRGLGAMIDPNARVYPHEGFAEFGRIAWNYPEFARRHCPRCWKFWSQEGLL